MVPWHSDNERIFEHGAIIASVSFGAERLFEIQHKKDRAQPTYWVRIRNRYLSRGDIKDFKEQTMESNRAFKSACLYMKCRAFKDICFAV